MRACAILSIAHPIMGVAALKLVGMVNLMGVVIIFLLVQSAQTIKYPP